MIKKIDNNIKATNILAQTIVALSVNVRANFKTIANTDQQKAVIAANNSPRLCCGYKLVAFVSVAFKSCYSIL